MKPRTAFILFLTAVLAASVSAQTTAFTYQGKLNDNGQPANAAFDLSFKLYVDAVGGAQLGPTVQKPGVQVVNGIFSVLIDFGDEFDGPYRYLEIAVAPAGSGNFTTLNPRQLISTTPYSLRSLNSTNSTNSENSLRLAGVAADQYVLTNDLRMTDDRNPRAGSDNYIQNNELAQQNGGFNVLGSGTVGGQLRGGQVRASTDFGIGNSRFLHNNGFANVFLGINAGFTNTNGSDNTVVGSNAGRSFADPISNSIFGSGSGEFISTASANSFFGYRAGRSVVAANYNSFFGSQAGQNNQAEGNSFFGEKTGLGNTTGDYNSFFGRNAGGINTTGKWNVFFGAATGSQNITGSYNTLIGARTDVALTDLLFATALGSGAVVSTSDTIVLGKFAGSYDNVVRPADKVVVPGGLEVLGSLMADGSNLTGLNAGNITSGFLPASRGGTGLAGSGTDGNFLRSNGSGWTSSPIGLADLPDLSANFIRNTNIQQALANFNIGGDGTLGGNLLVGNSATVIGSFDAGFNGTFGGTVSASNVNANNEFTLNFNRIIAAPGNNLFVGEGSGANNMTGTFNAFFGRLTGSSNTSGANNSYFGYLAGKNGAAGTDNSFFGSVSGFTNTGNNNSFFGSNAGYGNENGSENSFFGQGAGSTNTNASYGSFFGSNAGQFATGGFNAFFGYRSGFASSGAENSFFGTYSGRSNTVGTRNVFVGFSSGNDNESGNDNTLIGYKAGFGNTGSGNTLIGSGTVANGVNNTLIGSSALVLPTNLTNAAAIGANSMVTANNSLVLGSVNGANGATTTVKVGIGTTQPSERLDVRGGNVYVGSAGQGMILKSPNGTVCVLLSVSNAGALVTTPIACP